MIWRNRETVHIFLERLGAGIRQLLGKTAATIDIKLVLNKLILCAKSRINNISPNLTHSTGPVHGNTAAVDVGTSGAEDTMIGSQRDVANPKIGAMKRIP